MWAGLPDSGRGFLLKVRVWAQWARTAQVSVLPGARVQSSCLLASHALEEDREKPVSEFPGTPGGPGITHTLVAACRAPLVNPPLSLALGLQGQTKRANPTARHLHWRKADAHRTSVKHPTVYPVPRETEKRPVRQ